MRYIREFKEFKELNDLDYAKSKLEELKDLVSNEENYTFSYKSLYEKDGETQAGLEVKFNDKSYDVDIDELTLDGVKKKSIQEIMDIIEKDVHEEINISE